MREIDNDCVSLTSAIDNALCLGKDPLFLSLGIPFDCVNMEQALDRIGLMVESKLPHQVVTANVDFSARSRIDDELCSILLHSHLVLCDGMPLVWHSKFMGVGLPSRVAGSDLLPLLLKHAENKGWRVFLLGGTQKSLLQAVDCVIKKHPKLDLGGAYSPAFASVDKMDNTEILCRIHAAKPDILFVAFGCPKQEKWISRFLNEINVPVCIGVGASIDFLGGYFKRAPLWMQNVGLEWFYRLCQEPRRLFLRYAKDFVALCVVFFSEFPFRVRRSVGENLSFPCFDDATVICLPVSFDAVFVRNTLLCWSNLASVKRPIILDCSSVLYLDALSVGLLARLERNLNSCGQRLVLVGVTSELRSKLLAFRFPACFTYASDVASAMLLLDLSGCLAVDERGSFWIGSQSSA